MRWAVKKISCMRLLARWLKYDQGIVKYQNTSLDLGSAKMIDAIYAEKRKGQGSTIYLRARNWKKPGWRRSDEDILSEILRISRTWIDGFTTYKFADFIRITGLGRVGWMEHEDWLCVCELLFLLLGEDALRRIYLLGITEHGWRDIVFRYNGTDPYD